MFVLAETFSSGTCGSLVSHTYYFYRCCMSSSRRHSLVYNCVNLLSVRLRMSTLLEICACAISCHFGHSVALQGLDAPRGLDLSSVTVSL